MPSGHLLETILFEYDSSASPTIHDTKDYLVREAELANTDALQHSVASELMHDER